MIYAACGDSINNKELNEAYDLIDTMASNNYSERCAPKITADGHWPLNFHLFNNN